MVTLPDKCKIPSLFFICAVSELKLTVSLFISEDIPDPQNSNKKRKMLIKNNCILLKGSLNIVSINKYFNFYSIAKKNLFFITRTVRVFHFPACQRAEFSIKRYFFRPNQ